MKPKTGKDAQSQGGNMIASSVTGVSGPGDSMGKYKPQNNCSCSCCCGEETEVVKKENKICINKKIIICCGKNLKITVC